MNYTSIFKNSHLTPPPHLVETFYYFDQFQFNIYGTAQTNLIFFLLYLLIINLIQ